jgi:hypothetical protein
MGRQVRTKLVSHEMSQAGDVYTVDCLRIRVQMREYRTLEVFVLWNSATRVSEFLQKQPPIQIKIYGYHSKAMDELFSTMQENVLSCT